MNMQTYLKGFSFVAQFSLFSAFRHKPWAAHLLETKHSAITATPTYCNQLNIHSECSSSIPLICSSINFLYGTALLLEFCSVRLTLRRLTLLKFSLLAKPASATSEKFEFADTCTLKNKQTKTKLDKKHTQMRINYIQIASVIALKKCFLKCLQFSPPQQQQQKQAELRLTATLKALWVYQYLSF